MCQLRGRSLIEDYAANGGDDRLTEDALRQACSMKPRAREAATTPGALAALEEETGHTPDGAGDRASAENSVIEASTAVIGWREYPSTCTGMRLRCNVSPTCDPW